MCESFLLLQHMVYKEKAVVSVVVFGSLNKFGCFNLIQMLTLPNCLSSWMREPLPNELVRLAWKARVGYSWDKTATQRFWFKIERGTISRTI